MARAKLKRYRSLHTTEVSIRNQDVMAIKVTDRNAATLLDTVLEHLESHQADLLEKITPSGDVLNRRLRVKTPRGPRVAKAGSYVIKVQRGPDRFGMRQSPVFFVQDASIFEAQFEPNSETPARLYPAQI